LPVLIRIHIDASVYQNFIETMLDLGLEDHIVAAAGLDHSVKPELEETFSKLKLLRGIRAR